MINEKIKIFAIIQARMASTRLPGKILMELLPGKNVLECMLERVSRSKFINKIVVATTNNPKDKKLVDFLKSIRQEYFVGSENDVLDRYYHAAKKNVSSEKDILVRLTSDCPVIDPEIIDAVIESYFDNNCDFASNTLFPYTFPDGMDTEVVSFKNLEKAWREAVLPSHREHVTFYFWQNPKLFRIFYYKSPKDRSSYRLTLDYPEDYQLLKNIYQNLYGAKKDFNLEDIIKYLDANPKIKNLNATIARNAGWRTSFKQDKKFTKVPKNN